jgi:hypothetical protein
VAVDVSAVEDGEKPGNFLEVWQRSLHIMIRANQPRPGDTDLFLEPDVGRYSFVDLRQVDEIFDRGRRTAERALPQLRDR